MTRKDCISVIGGSRCSPQEAETAERVGTLLAKRDIVVICGGRGGVMEAVCRGAQRAGGCTVGFLPGSDPAEGNAYLSLVFPTALGHARNVLVVQGGQVVIAIGGGYGTLSEIGMALKMGRPVIGLGTWKAKNQDQAAGILHLQSAEEAVMHAIDLLSAG